MTINKAKVEIRFLFGFDWKEIFVYIGHRLRISFRTNRKTTLLNDDTHAEMLFDYLFFEEQI